jgi:uncharacterized membrane-anchored protein
MSVYSLQGPGDAGPQGPAGDRVAGYALRVVGLVVDESALGREQLAAAQHDAVRARQLAEQARLARQGAGHAQARAAAEELRADAHRRIPRRAGTMLAAGLAVLDAVPAYWSAQAFGLDQTSTLIITVLLCAALGGAMWLMDLFTSQRRRRALRVLQGCLAGGLAALFALRLDYLLITGAAGLWLAVIQALALTGLSGVLVATGYVLLAHRMPKPLAVAQRAARHAAPEAAAEAAQAAQVEAGASRAALEHTIIAWALTHTHDGISHDQLLPALRQALAALLDG